MVGYYGPCVVDSLGSCCVVSSFEKSRRGQKGRERVVDVLIRLEFDSIQYNRERQILYLPFRVFRVHGKMEQEKRPTVVCCVVLQGDLCRFLVLALESSHIMCRRFSIDTKVRDRPRSRMCGASHSPPIALVRKSLNHNQKVVVDS